MGFLSKTKDTESSFESFYGTSMAGSEVNLSEMGEGQVSDYSFAHDLPIDAHPLAAIFVDDISQCIPLHQRRTLAALQITVLDRS